MYYLSLVVAAVIFLVRLPSMRSINMYFFLFLFSLFALTHARIHGPITNQSDLYNSGQTGRFSGRVICRSSFSKIVFVRLRFTPFFFLSFGRLEPRVWNSFLGRLEPRPWNPLPRSPDAAAQRGTAERRAPSRPAAGAPPAGTPFLGASTGS